MELLRNSVVLAYPTGGSNENCFTESLIGTLSYDAGHANLIADVRSVEGLYVADNRDLAARRFMRYKLCAKCRSVIDNGNRDEPAKPLKCETCCEDYPLATTPEWFWFVDTDISFQSYDVLYQLLAYADAAERPIMSALYFGYMQNGAIVPVWFALTPDKRIEMLKNFSSGLNKLGVVGMGCCLIHRSVFEKLGKSYAHTGYLYFGHDRAPWTPEADIENDITAFGEDNCFCHRCNQLDIPIYGVGSIVVEHRKKRYENMKTFLQTFAQSEEKNDATGTTLRLRREPGQEASRAAIQRVVQPDDGGPQPGPSANGHLGSGETSTPVRLQLVR